MVRLDEFVLRLNAFAKFRDAPFFVTFDKATQDIANRLGPLRGDELLPVDCAQNSAHGSAVTVGVATAIERDVQGLVPIALTIEQRQCDNAALRVNGIARPGILRN